jgi:thiol-disulfide isomerase/thioredoxin/biopolymer transport protein ExbD
MNSVFNNAASIKFVILCMILAESLASADDKVPREDPASSFPVLSGIGAALSITEAGPQIEMVLPGSAAEKSGELHNGDRILSIRNGDGTIDLKGKPLGDVVSLIRGPVGTPVTLEVLPKNRKASFLVTVKREAVAIPALAVQRTYDKLIGKPAPTTQFSALDQSSRISLSKYTGKIVVVDFWASWCGTCFAPVDKMQEIARAHPEYTDRVVLLTVTVDTDLRGAIKIIEKRKWKETTHLSLTPEKLEAIEIATVPALMIVSPDGKIAAVGDPHSFSVEKEIAKLLSPDPREDENVRRLPAGGGPDLAVPREEARFTFTVGRDGAISLEEKPIILKDVAAKVARLADHVRLGARTNGSSPDSKRELSAVIVIRADDETPCSTILQLVLDCQKSGFVRFVLKSTGQERAADRPAESGAAPAARDKEKNSPAGLRALPIVLAADQRGRLAWALVGEVRHGTFDSLRAELTSIFSDPELPFDQASISVDPRLMHSELRRIVEVVTKLNVTRIGLSPLEPRER